MQRIIHIVLVDDDEDDIAFFRLALNDQAVATHLTTLTDGDQVMPFLRAMTGRPDLLLLDLNLPKLHGRQVLMQIKNSPVSREMPIFMLTTSSAQEDIDFCLAMGATQFLTKPTSLAALRKMVADLLAAIQ